MKKRLIHKKIMPGAVIILIGISIILFAMSPQMNPPQCRSFQTPADVGYRCVQGVNIGVGIILMLGSAVIAAGSFAAFTASLSPLIDGRKNKEKESELSGIQKSRFWINIILSIVLFFFSLLTLYYFFPRLIGISWFLHELIREII